MIQMPPHYFDSSNEIINALKSSSSTTSSSNLINQLIINNSNSLTQINNTIDNRAARFDPVVTDSDINNSILLITQSNSNTTESNINIQETLSDLNILLFDDVSSNLLNDEMSTDDIFGNFLDETIIKNNQNNQSNSSQYYNNNNNIQLTTYNLNIENFNNNYNPIIDQNLPQLSIQFDQQQSSQSPSSSNIINLIDVKKEKFVPFDDDSQSSFAYSSSSINGIKPIKTVLNKKNGKTTIIQRYGPVTVRPRQNPAPTLASGRKSKNAPLPAEEERKREERRRRNREAAEKCKQNREVIVKSLEEKYANLINEQKELLDEFESLNNYLTAQRTKLSSCTSCTSNQKINNSTNVNNFSSHYQVMNNNPENYNYYQQNSQYNQMNLQQTNNLQTSQYQIQTQSHQTSQNQNFVYNNNNDNQWGYRQL